MPDADPRPGPDALRLTALSLTDAAGILSRAGGRPVTEDMIREDLSAGAPLNPDGTLNLVHYAAWLVRELSDGD